MTSSSSNHHQPSSKTEGDDTKQPESFPSQTHEDKEEKEKTLMSHGHEAACGNEGGGNTQLQSQPVTSTDTDAAKEEVMRDSVEENGRERLKRHRNEVAGRVRIPEIWGQEDFLKEWIDCSVFDALLAPAGLLSARAALVREGGRVVSSGKLQI